MTPTLWTPALQQWLEQRSFALGFDLCGIAAAEGLSSPAEAQDAARFEDWITAGRAGEMDYLKRRDEQSRLLRSSVKVAQPWANSVIACAVNYSAPGPRSIDPAPSTAGWIARYAWSGQASHTGEPQSQPGTSELKPADYHDLLLPPLQQLARELEQLAGAASKCYVDTGPLVERSLAARAGIGWIGKNTCVLHQAHGSWLLLGSIVCSLRLPPEIAALPSPDRCGTCTRCIDACPTGALPAPYQMDASRCIAYLTIEKKGAIPEDLRPLMGRQVFGCDICQDVCPWNRRASAHPLPPTRAIPPREELINPELEWLAGMDAPAFKRWFKGSPLERTRRSRLHRNVAIAMGNSGDGRHLPRLRAWAAGNDPVLAEAAAWAMERIRNGTSSERARLDTPSPALC